MELDERKKVVLSCVIQSYIQTGEPVGSSFVVSQMNNSVSSATIRNDMAFLEKTGLIIQPHTSAGRIPTKSGYRYYIDNLMPKSKLNQKEQKAIDAALNIKATDPETFIETFSKAVASVTNLTSVLTLPVPERIFITQIQILRVQKNSVFAVIITSSGVVKNKSIKTDGELSAEDIIVLNTFLNNNFTSVPIDELTPAAIQTMVITLGEFSFSLAPIIFEVYKMSCQINKSSVIVEGRSNLLLDLGKDINIKQLFEILENRQKVLDIIAKNKNDVSILIG
ncbi:MAG: heat-inducible transcriptional repressor HrcA, partial [Clostridia bacterium]